MGLRDVIAGWLMPSSADSGDGTKLPGPGSDFWYQNVVPKVYGNIMVTPEVALTVTTVYTCCRILAETISSLPFNMYEKTGEGRLARPQHPLDMIISQSPNATQTAVDFWEMMVLQMALEGNAYAEIIPGRRGAVDQLIPIRASRVTPKRAKDGRLRFEVVADPAAPEISPKRILLEEELFRLNTMSYDGIKGLRAVDLAAGAISLSLSAEQYAGRVFSNMLNIGGFLIHPGRLSEEAQKNLIHSLLQRFAGPQNAHRPIVLQEGMKFEAASMKAREAQLIEARVHQIKEIARVFRIPDHMLGIRDSQPRANVEQDALDFVKYTLRPWVKRIEQAVSRDLIVNGERFVAKFNMDALLRGDSASRAEYFKASLGSGGAPGWMSPNEIRKIEGLNTVPGKDEIPSGTSSGIDNSQQEGTNIIRLDTRSDVQKLVDKEIATVRKKCEKHAGDPDAFDDSITAFYGGHVSFVMEMLKVPKSVARAYCEFQRDKILAAGKVEDVLVEWDTSLEQEIEETLREHREGRNEDEHLA